MIIIIIGVNVIIIITTKND